MIKSKTYIYFFFILFINISPPLSAQYSENKNVNEEDIEKSVIVKEDSIIKELSYNESLINIKLNNLLIKKIDSLEFAIAQKIVNTEHSDDKFIEWERGFWRDYTNWALVIFAGLLALTPISIAFIEYYKSTTKKSLKSLKLEIETAKSEIKNFTQSQTYQELYFEDVLKPTINSIADVFLELSMNGYLNIDLVEELSKKYYDFERVINLTHFDNEIRAAANDYLNNRNSIYLKVKLETLLSGPKNQKLNTELQLLIRQHLDKYNV